LTVKFIPATINNRLNSGKSCENQALCRNCNPPKAESQNAEFNYYLFFPEQGQAFLKGQESFLRIFYPARKRFFL
jgi:hypothetical protein